MTHRPWPIVVIAIFHILAPFVNMYMSMSLLNKDFDAYLALQLKQDPLFLYIWILLPLFCGAALLTFRMWSYYAFLFFMVLVSLYTLKQRLLYPYRVSLPLFLLMELINFLVIIYFLSPTVKTIYLNKRIRWWQQKPRYLLSQQGVAQINDRNTDIQILNISEGGALVKSTQTLDLKSDLQLKLKYKTIDLDIKALVIHAHDSHYGLLFKDQLAKKLQLKKLLRQLKADNIPVRGSELSLIQSFVFWIKDLFKTGHGVFPDLKN